MGTLLVAHPIVMIIIPIGLWVPIPIGITRGITRVSLLLLGVGIVVPMLMVPVGYLWGRILLWLLLMGVVLLLIRLVGVVGVSLRVFIIITE